tara:strand:- start:1290 stop:2465 length:1176 start_codon:yes stop_codon:yes gene_type:complete
MSQVSDVNLANQGFASFRTELNNILGALNSMHSGTSRPGSATTGTMWLDTTNSGSNSLEIKFFDGSDDISVATIDTSANTINFLDSVVTGVNVVTDTTPQLGGNLDTNDKEIVTISNKDLILAPNGTGAVEIKGNSASGKLLFNCEANSHHVSLQAPAHSAFSGNVEFTLPANTGTNGQFLTTDGSGVLSFTTIAAQTNPTVADVSQTIAPATATTINITGTNFVSIPQVDFIKTDGSVTRANTVSFTSATSLSVNVTLATGNYHVRIENPDGNAGRSTNNIITASTSPTFSTSAGSLGTFAGNFSGTLATISGSSDSTIAFSETTSVLSGAGVTLNTSTGALTTTDFGGSSTTPTTYNFTIRITDAEGQTADRSFSFTSSFGATGGGQFN